jgi:uncharacterized protein with gpF-like domain
VTKPVVRRPRPVTKVVAASPVELKPVRPAAATRARYQKALDAAVTEMHRSILYWIGANYKRNTPEIMALDASPARELRAALRKLARRWQANFDRLAPRLAEYFATSVSERVDGQLDRMLRDAGFTVRFKMTRAQNDAMQATIGENVSLIKSVAGKYLTDIEGDVMRSVQEGRDLAGLTEALTNTYGVTRRRAETKARWLHSAGGRTPRPEHVAFSGRLYDIDKGAFLEGEWTWPGRAINCRCVSVPVVPGFEE